MSGYTNITANTPARLVFRTGSLTVNTVNLGALEGDVVFRIRKEDYIPELAGAAGEVKGTRHRMVEEAFLEVTMSELTLSALARAIVGVNVSSNASSEVLGSSDDCSDVVGCISDTEYVTVVFKGQHCLGYDVIITLYNAIVDGDFEGTFRDKAHFSFPVVFKATYDPVDPDMRPWVIVRETA